MDADEEDVVVAIDEFDGFLQVAVHLGADQPAEAAYAVVDVYDEVAGCELVELLQGEGHLAAACAVAPEVILMEAAEDLVVGEEAAAEGVVGEALVEGAIDGGEGDVVAAVFEDVADAFGLLLAVGEQVDGVALAEVLAEGLADEVEVLLEEGLGGGVEAEDGGGVFGAGLEVQACEGLEGVGEALRPDELAAHGFAVGKALVVFVYGLLIPQGGDALAAPCGVAHHHGCAPRQELQERAVGVAITAYLGDDADGR